MTWHEIVNDTVSGVPLAATYCPLCSSGIAFDLRLDDRVLSVGTSGRLFSSNVVMYDRQTESLWPQLTGLTSVGVLTGEKLDAIPMGLVGWQDFRSAFADAWVLSRDTGFAGTTAATRTPGITTPAASRSSSARMRTTGWRPKPG